MTTTFQESFLWGAATSAYQIEGAPRTDGKGPSVWDAFCQIPGKTANGETGDVACDHYHRWREDVELMRRLNLGAYRFSVSWPRVLPLGRGAVNTVGLDFYDRLVDGLQAAGIEPVATLYHWDTPLALQLELGGWASPDFAGLFADYAGVVYDRLGDRVKYWLTINEPWCVAELGYFTGVHAPGAQDRALAYRVGHNVLRAHAYAVARYRAGRHNRGLISFALNANYTFPATDRPQDVAAAERALLNFAGWFGDPAHFGDYPAVLRARLGSLLPEFTAEDAALLRGSMDYLALNYYTSDVVRHAPGAGPLELEFVEQPNVSRTMMGWPIVPEGLGRLLRWLAARYQGLPIYVTENGAAMDDRADADGYVDDQDRIAFLRDHLAVVAQAIADGLDIRGYLAWSLIDNLEWAHGYSKCFGLMHCDRRTLKRTIKASGHWYAKVIADRTLDGPVGAASPSRAGGG